MPDLYVVMSMLCAGIVIKLLHALMRRGRHAGGTPTAADRRLAVYVMCLVPALSLSVYMALGRPDLPGAPAIFIDPGELAARQDALLAKRPMEILVNENPDDMGALMTLAQINRSIGRFGEAVKFQQRAIIVAQKNDELLLRVYLEDLGRMQVLANKGIVGDDALGTFDYAISISATDPIARYYKALARAQRGDTAGAIEDWTEMLGQGTPLAYWKRNVRQAIAVARAGRLGAEPLDLP